MNSSFDPLLYRTWAEVDLEAIVNNHNLLRSLLPADVKVAAVVKADAYGHGAVAVALALRELVDYFAVATVEEAVELKMAGIGSVPVLVLGQVLASKYNSLAEYNIEAAVSNYDEAAAMSEFALRAESEISVHAAIDTGMSRIGFPCDDGGVRDIVSLTNLGGIRLAGIFSHYAAADCDMSYTRLQEARFAGMLHSLDNAGVHVPCRHICNSAGILFDGEKFDMVREGILLYGLSPSGNGELDPRLRTLRPAMSLRSHISNLRRLPAGTPVSYGCTFVTERESLIATVQAGYADGVPRALSNKGDFLIRGRRAPIAGLVCMDQVMVDVTDIPGVSVGDTVTIFGGDGGEFISADEIAALSGTISYEIICGISKRVPRVYF